MELYRYDSTTFVISGKDTYPRRGELREVGCEWKKSLRKAPYKGWAFSDSEFGSMKDFIVKNIKTFHGLTDDDKNRLNVSDVEKKTSVIENKTESKGIDNVLRIIDKMKENLESTVVQLSMLKREFELFKTDTRLTVDMQSNTLSTVDTQSNTTTRPTVHLRSTASTTSDDDNDDNDEDSEDMNLMKANPLSLKVSK